MGGMDGGRGGGAWWYVAEVDGLGGLLYESPQSPPLQNPYLFSGVGPSQSLGRRVARRRARGKSPQALYLGGLGAGDWLLFGYCSAQMGSLDEVSMRMERNRQ